MDDGEADERMAAEMMRQAQAAIMAIQCWYLVLADERKALTGEPVFQIEPVWPDGSRH